MTTYPHTKPTAVLFDWDNTLVDTMPLISTSINEARIHFGMEPWSLQEIKEKTQLSAKDGLPKQFGEHWQEALKIYREFYYQNHLKLLGPTTGALALLTHLKNLSIPMGLVSNKVGPTLRQEVSHLGWEGFFSAQIGSGDAPKDKPDPEPALLALEQMGISPSLNIWFVGDTPVDWQCATAIGCAPVPIGFDHQEAASYKFAVQNCSILEKILIKL